MKIFGLFALVLCALLGYAAASAIGNPAEALEAQESSWGHGGHRGGHHGGGHHYGGGGHHYGGGGHHYGGGGHHGGGGWHRG